MFWRRSFDSEQVRAGLCAGVAPVLHTASGCPWYASMLISLTVIAVFHCANPKSVPRAVAVARELWNTLMASTVLGWLCSYWPTFPPYAVAVSTVALSLWICAQSQSGVFRAWGVAFYFIGALLLGVLVSAAGDVESENLLPAFQPGMGWEVVLGLLLAFRLGAGNVTFALAPVSSFIAVGVLGLGAAVPFYELSRSVRFLGVAPRFESLCACAMTMSFFAALSTLLDSEKTAVPAGWMKAMKSAWVLTLWFLGVNIPAEILSLGIILLWVLPSLLGNRVEMKLCTGRNLQNREKED